MAGSCCISFINNSVSTPRVIVLTFLNILNGAQYSNHTSEKSATSHYSSAGESGTTGHDASRRAARHKTAAASRRETPVTQ
jgi:hypothetical protein